MQIKSLFLPISLALAGFSMSACSVYDKMLTVPKTLTATGQVKPKQIPEASAAYTAEEKEKAYKSAMQDVGKKIKQDPNYKKLALATPEDKSWFGDLTYKVWDHQITKEQFVSAGLKKYPDRSYEFNFVADGLLSKPL